MKEEVAGAYSGVGPFGKEPVVRKITMPREMSDRIDELAMEQEKDPVVMTYELIAQEMGYHERGTVARSSKRKRPRKL